MNRLYKFVNVAGTEISKSFNLVPITFPLSEDEHVVTGCPRTYESASVILDVVDNVYKVENNNKATSTWYISLSGSTDATGSANIISGSYYTGSYATVYFNFIDHLRTPEDVNTVIIAPSERNVGFEDSFVVQEPVTYVTDAIGEFTTTLAAIPLSVTFKCAKRNMTFTVLPSGSCTASAIIVSGLTTSKIVTPANLGSVSYTAQASDLRYLRLNGTASYAVSASYALNGGTGGNSDSSSWASASISASYATSASCFPSIGDVWSGSIIQPASTKNASAYGDGKFVIVGAGPSLHSQDGLLWSTGSGYSFSNCIALAYGNGLFVAQDFGNGNMVTSTDGIAWTVRTPISSLTVQYGGITYGNGKFIMVGSIGPTSKAYTSTDGITWTLMTVGSGVNSYRNITYGNGLFVASGFTPSFTVAIATSPDGVNWAEYDSITSGLGHVVFGNGVFAVYPTEGQTAITSTDGFTWTEQSTTGLPILSDYFTLSYGAGIFVVCRYGISTSNGWFAISTDGINWTSTNTPSSAPYWGSPLSSVYANGIYVMAASTGIIVSGDADRIVPAEKHTVVGDLTVHGTLYVGNISCSVVTASLLLGTASFASFAGTADLALTSLTSSYPWTATEDTVHSGSVKISGSTEVFGTGVAGGITIDGTNNPALTLRSNGETRGHLFSVTAGSDFFQGSDTGSVGIRTEGKRIYLGTHAGLATLTVSGSGVGIGAGMYDPVNALDVNGNISCSIITASLLLGTSSFATSASNARTASIVHVASNEYAFKSTQYPLAGMYFNVSTPGTEIKDITGDTQYTFGVETNPRATFNYPLTVPNVTASLQGTASWATNAVLALNSNTASYVTGSTIRLNAKDGIVGSMIELTTGSRTAELYVAGDHLAGAPYPALYIVPAQADTTVFFGKSGKAVGYLDFSNVANFRSVPSKLAMQNTVGGTSEIISAGDIALVPNTYGNGFVISRKSTTDSYRNLKFKAYAGDLSAADAGGNVFSAFTFTTATGSALWHKPHTIWTTGNSEAVANRIMTLDMSGSLNVKSEVSASTFSGNQYGTCYNNNNPITVDIVTQDVHVRVNAGLTASYVNGFTFANQQLTASYSGKYSAVWSMGVECGSPTTEIEGGLMVNNTVFTGSTSHAEAVNANRPICIAGAGIVDLTSGSAVGLCLSNHSSAGDLIVSHATLLLTRLGN